MAKERIINSFEGGMNNDLDSKLRQSNSYEMSINGRIVYNQDGTLSWENTNGNVSAITNIASNTQIIGHAEFPDFLILFTILNDTYNIGYVTFTESGSGDYKGNIFSDSDLNFNEEYTIQAKPFVESNELMRVYWTDNYNEPRVLTFKNIGTTEVELQSITKNVFSTNIVPDWEMPEVSYQGLVDGSLRTGVYQYAVRFLTVDGYQTPWSPITYPIIVTGSIPQEDESSTYGMKNADVIGNTGTQIIISGIDRRYDSYEVAYVHTIASSGAKEAGIASVGNINKNTYQPIFVNHVSIENATALNIQELYDLKDVITKAKTIQIHDKRLWFGNTETKKSFSIPSDALANLTVKPVFRGLISDKAGNLIHRYGDSKSTVNPEFLNQKFIKRKYGSKNILIGLDNNKLKKEYSNYQSSVICNHFTGYFRGETYRFAAVFFDKKGYPFFAEHLADVTMPLFTSKDNNNPLTWRRIQQDGNITSKTQINVGKMGGIPTETKDNWTSVGGNDRKLKGKASSTSQSGSGEDEIIDSSGNYSSTKLIYDNNGNHLDFDSYAPSTRLTDPKTNEQYSETHNPVASRILGLKFGGINLEATLDDGTKLKDIISGVLIVRAERTGADEQVKDMGAVFNAIEGVDGNLAQDYTVEGKKASHINPFIFTGGTPNDPQTDDANGNSNYSIEGLNIIDAAEQNLMGRPTPSKNLLSFDGVNYKIANQSYSLKPNSKIRLDYICDLSNVETLLNTSDNQKKPIFEQAGLIKKLWSDRHFISKNLNTYNTNSITAGSYFYQCGSSKPINGVIAATTPTNKYGNIANRIVTTNTWLSLYNGTNEYRDMIRRVFQIFKEYDGTKTLGGTDAAKFIRGVATKTLLLNSDIEYVLSQGQWNHTNVSGNTDTRINETMKQSSFYVASIVEENDNPYGGLSLNALQNTRFHTTGTFLSVNDIMSETTLDGVEVWGGDCYLDLFSYARILPYLEARTNAANVSCIASNQGDQSTDEVGWDGKEFRDYAHGIVVPLQSKYNFRLSYKNTSDGVPTYEEVLTANGATIGGAASFGSDGQTYELKRADKSYYNESSINGLYFMDGDTCPKVYDNFQIQDALSYTDKVRAYASKPVDYIETVKFPARWHWSNLKQPYNAKIDKFRQFEELSNFDLDGIYGGITGSSLLYSKIYSIQEKGFGRLRSSDRAVLSDPNANDLFLGEGGVMDGIDYISKSYGTLFRDSIVSSGKNIYFVDTRMAKILRFGQDGLEPISDSKGLHNFIEPYLKRLGTRDTIASKTSSVGIISAYDFNNNDVVITIKDGNNANIEDYNIDNDTVSWDTIKPLSGLSTLPNDLDITQKTGALTLLYSEVLSGFHGIHTYYPTAYVNFGDRLYMTKNDGKGTLWLNGKGEKSKFFGSYYYSMLRININKFPNVVKTFDNSAWNLSNQDALSNINKVSAVSEGITHTYNNLSSVIANLASSYSTNNRAKYREGILKFPLREIDGNSKPRLRGKSMSLEVWVKNDNNNNKFSLTSVDTIVRV